MKINLLPQEYRPQSAVNLPRLLVILLFIVTIFGMSVWTLSEWFVLNRVSSDLERVNQDLALYGQQYQNVQAIEAEQSEVNQRKQEINTLLQSYLPVEDYLGEIINPLPEQVWLKNLSIDGNGVSLDGQSNRMRAVAMLMMDLEDSKAFQGTNLSVINNPNSKGIGDIFSFKLTFAVEKAGLKQ